MRPMRPNLIGDRIEESLRRSSRERAISRARYVTLAFGLAITLGWAWGLASLRISLVEMQAENSKLRSRIDSLLNAPGPSLEWTHQWSRQRNDLPTWSSLLDSVLACLPEGYWLEEIDYRDEILSLSGRSPGSARSGNPLRALQTYVHELNGLPEKNGIGAFQLAATRSLSEEGQLQFVIRTASTRQAR